MAKKHLKIAILGDGSWGTTLAILLNKKGYKVTLWGAFADYVNFLNKNRINKKFLPQAKIPQSVNITDNLSKAIENASVIVLAVPAQYLSLVLKNLKKYPAKDKIFLNVAKGIENRSLLRISQLVEKHLGKCKYAVLSGPTIAHEVLKGIPSTAVIASKRLDIAKNLQNIFTTDYFRLYTNNDVIGAELAGSVKNIIAIACGISDGLSLGTNTKAAIVSRGIAEMKRLGAALGAKEKTFSGISGIGDLVTTCFSKHSRNRHTGEQIGKGKSLSFVLKQMDSVAEGVPTAKSVYRLAKKHKVDMPITNEIYKVLFLGKNPKSTINSLMTRSKKAE